MTQLELFDEQSEEDFAMSLTSAQLANLKNSNYEAFQWIRDVRHAVQEYQARCRRLKAVLEDKLETAKYGKGRYQLDRYPGW